MWAFLIDCSGSMADGFSADAATTHARTRVHEAVRKLDAAVESMRVQLQRMRPTKEVVLIAFDESARVVHRGVAADHEVFARAAAELEPRDGTNIAAALALGRRELAGMGRGGRILLISDGLSDLAEAEAEARACADEEIDVSMHLIDPVPQAEAMAAAIIEIAGGEWLPITSAEATRQAGAQHADAEQEADVRAMAMLAEARQTREAAKGEAVCFTAAHPERVVAERWYPLRVVAHLEHLGVLVRRRLEDALAAESLPATASSSPTRIAREQEITVLPRIEGVRVNPPRQSVLWLENQHALPFKIQAEREGEPVRRGQLELQVDGLPVGHVPVQLRVVAADEADAKAKIKTAHMVDTAFASYAREDAAVVEHCRRAYAALGIHLFVDRRDLDSGSAWRAKLRHFIGDKADLFNLFWSPHARDSTAVDFEIELALDRAARVGMSFVRGLYWQEPLEPPTRGLEARHFHRLSLPPEVERAAAEEASRPAVPRGRPPRERIPVTVIPLLEIEESLQQLAREAVEEAVAYLEELTALRYYPVPTLLVERWLVQTARHMTTIDLPEQGPIPVQPMLHRAFKLAAIEFHRSRFEDLSSRGRRAEWYGLGVDDEPWIRETKEQLESVPKALERLFGGDPTMPWQRALLDGPEPRRDPRGHCRLLFERWSRLVDQAAQLHPELHVDLSGDDDALVWLLDLDPESEPWPKRTESRDRMVPIEDYRHAVARVTAAMLEAMSMLPSSQQRRAAVAGIASTYGAYIDDPHFDRRLAASLQVTHSFEGEVASRLSLPGTPKVLLCMEALQVLQNKLGHEGDDPAVVRERARKFLRSVIVHEHFHAMVERGLDVSGRASAWTREPRAWREALPVNESLACWLQRHYLRDDDALYELLSAYIEAGDYPQWPYRGAARVEAIHDAEAMPGVRRLLERLRERPERALDELRSEGRPKHDADELES